MGVRHAKGLICTERPNLERGTVFPLRGSVDIPVDDIGIHDSPLVGDREVLREGKIL